MPETQRRTLPRIAVTHAVEAGSGKSSSRSEPLRGMSMAELAGIREKKLAALFEVRDRRQRDLDDKALPPVQDPARLEQARQATEYYRGRGPSPFTGLSHEELAAIKFDDSGSHTINERFAATKEINARSYRWKMQFLEARDAERRRTGKTDAADAQLAAYYAQLPLLDQVQYFAGYPPVGAGAYMAIASYGIP